MASNVCLFFLIGIAGSCEKLICQVHWLGQWDGWSGNWYSIPCNKVRNIVLVLIFVCWHICYSICLCIFFLFHGSTAISEDLGQVEYILTDKTGTLTENKMIFKRCFLGGTFYGNENGDALKGKALVIFSVIIYYWLVYFQLLPICCQRNRYRNSVSITWSTTWCGLNYPH